MAKFTIILFFITAFGFAQTDEILDFGNSKLHYKTVGKGKPILIINGGPGMNCEGFTFIAHELSKMGFQAITYDQRGTGKSIVEPISPETITMDLMVDDIEKLRKHLNIQNWIVFGHSFGGMMATYYASKHPETIDKLIFSSSGGVNMKFTSYGQERMRNNLSQTERDSLDYYQTKINKGDSSRETLQLRAKYLANAYVFNKKNAPIIAERLTQSKFEITALVFDNLFKIKFDCSMKFGNFKQKVLVLQGKNDIISPETAKEIASTFPNSKLVLIENCAHYGWLDAPKIYFDSIKSFLKD